MKCSGSNVGMPEKRNFLPGTVTGQLLRKYPCEKGNREILLSKLRNLVKKRRVLHHTGYHLLLRGSGTNVVIANGFALHLQVSGRCQINFFLLPLFPGKTPFESLLDLQLHGFPADFPHFRNSVPVNLTLNRTGKGTQKICRLSNKIHPLFVGRKIILLLNRPQLIFHAIGGFFQQNPETIRPEFFQKLVRILGIPHLQDLHLQSCLFQHGNCPLSSALTGFIAVINEDHLLGVPGHQHRMFLRQRGSQRSHRAVKSILVQGNRIHVALYQNQIAKFTFLCEIQSEQVFALIENFRFRRV